MENNPLIIASHTTPTGETLTVAPGPDQGTLSLAIATSRTRAEATLPTYEVRPLIEDLAHDSTVTVARVAYPESEPLVVLEEVGSQKYLRVCIYLPHENLLKPVEIRLEWRTARCLALAVREALLARTVVALLLGQGSLPAALLDRPAAPADPVPSPQPPTRAALTRDEAEAAGKRAVTSILAQLRPTMPRPNNKMVASSFRALTNAIRQRGWDEPVGMHAELARLLLDHKPTPTNPLTEAEARALTAWLTSADALPILDALWPVEEPAEAVPCQP